MSKKLYVIEVFKYMDIYAESEEEALEIAATYAGEPEFELELIEVRDEEEA